MRLLRAAALLCALVATLGLAAPALAAFPGRNGQLAVQPASGGGLLLVGPQGKGLQRICTDTSLCGTPVAPRFSPDGRDIAFLDAGAKTPAVVASDNTCMWCLLGSPLDQDQGTAPSFQNGGQALTYTTATGLWRAPLTGGAAKKLRQGTFSGAVWSAKGALAFARAGWIWLASPGGSPHRLTRGEAPNFSPGGTELLFARAGSIWVISTGGGSAQRLLAGSGPVFSPDGKQLAFLRGGRVYVATAAGKHAKVVPGVRGRAVDWQPLPRSGARPCRVPAGSILVAQTAEAMVTRNPDTPFTPWYGCLQAIGKHVPLVALSSVGGGYNASLSSLQLSGRFAAFSLSTSDQYGNCANTVTEVDLSTGKATQLYSQNCTAADKGVDGLGLDSSGFAAWHAFEQTATPQPLQGIACPSSGLCVAVDGHGNAATTATPAAGGWSLNHVAPAFSRVVCSSATLCLGLSGGSLVTSTDPTSGSWSTPAALDSVALNDVACPSSTSCVAVDSAGNALTTDNPSGAAAAWISTPVAAGDDLTGVSCPSAHLCLAVGQSGTAFTTTDMAHWTPAPADPDGSTLEGVACPSTSLCVASDSAGNVLTLDPTAGHAWTLQPLGPPAGALSTGRPTCASSTLCLVPAAGDVFVSTDPGVGGSWTATPLVSSPNALTAATCAPSTTLCAATDQKGDVLVASDAGGGGAPWSTAAVDTPPCGSCISEQLWVRDDLAIRVLDSVLPGPGGLITAPALAGNSTTVTWAHGGAAQSAQLR